MNQAYSIRIADLFLRRKINIESLTVSEIEDKANHDLPLLSTPKQNWSKDSKAAVPHH
jgi:hypothetical protein